MAAEARAEEALPALEAGSAPMEVEPGAPGREAEAIPQPEREEAPVAPPAM
jgi:hypothetical protein